MTIYAFNEPNEESKEFVTKSLKENGISRFGWSWYDSANLLKLNEKSWDEMNKDEIMTWKKASFLLEIEPGDWVVHINVPYWGACIAAKVTSEYFFEEKENEIADFRHCLNIDKKSVIQFDRNDEEIHPLISRKLKLRGKYWRIYDEKEFFSSIENVKKGNKITKEGDSVGIHYLKNEIKPLFEELTIKIHKTHPEKKLEYLLCNIFKNIPNVTNAYVNGSGWGTDFGADIVVKYNAGLKILNLQREETLVVQVKSYEGVHYDTNSVDQIKMAMEKFNANYGLIITTAQKSDELEKAIEKLSLKIDRPVGLLAGEDVAKFLLKYENGILFEI